MSKKAEATAIHPDSTYGKLLGRRRQRQNTLLPSRSAAAAELTGSLMEALGAPIPVVSYTMILYTHTGTRMLAYL